MRRKGPRLINGNDLAIKIVEDGAAFAAQLVRDQFERSSETCGSPIERIFLAQMMHPQWARDYSFGTHPLNFDISLPDYGALAARGWTATPPPEAGIWIFPQYPVAQYQVDFMLWSTGMQHYKVEGDRRLIIECDGHDFHEKTKDQVRRDKARERIIVACGIPVMRFAGSEIYADSAACVEQALNFLLEV